LAKLIKTKLAKSISAYDMKILYQEVAKLRKDTAKFRVFIEDEANAERKKVLLEWESARCDPDYTGSASSAKPAGRTLNIGGKRKRGRPPTAGPHMKLANLCKTMAVRFAPQAVKLHDSIFRMMQTAGLL